MGEQLTPRRSGEIAFVLLVVVIVGPHRLIRIRRELVAAILDQFPAAVETTGQVGTYLFQPNGF